MTQSGAAVPGATVAIDGAAPVQVDGAGSFSVDAPSATLHAVISAPGYLTRETRLGAGHPLTVDLISTAPPFSTIFYGQLVRNLLESPTPDIVRTLPAAPAFYLQTAGLSSGNVDRLIAAIREIVPAMTGGKFAASTIETGATARPEQAGWIVIELVNEPDSGHCGRAFVGTLNGHVWLNYASTPTTSCSLNGDLVGRPSIQHEIGHALGFNHIDVRGALMNGTLRWDANTVATDGEKYHAGVAYHRSAGNRDPDNDAVTSTPLAVRSRVVVD